MRDLARRLRRPRRPADRMHPRRALVRPPARLPVPGRDGRRRAGRAARRNPRSRPRWRQHTAPEHPRSPLPWKPLPSVVIITRAGAKSLDYLLLGDSALVIEDGAGRTEVVTDKRMDEVVAAEYQAMLALPTGTPEHQAARIAFVRKQQPMRNQPGGYPVASTDPRAAGEALTGSFPARDIWRGAMLSDGVTRFAEFGLGTWAELLSILADSGPAGLFARS